MTAALVAVVLYAGGRHTYRSVYILPYLFRETQRGNAAYTFMSAALLPLVLQNISHRR